MDLYADRPWALSPALASMNHLALTEKPQEGPVVKEDSVERIKHQCEGESGASEYGASEYGASEYGASEYGASEYGASESGASCSVLPCWSPLDRAEIPDNYPPEGGDEKAQAAARKRWMSDKTNREKISLNHDTHVSMEFCNGYLGGFLMRRSLHPQPHSCSTAYTTPLLLTHPPPNNFEWTLRTPPGLSACSPSLYPLLAPFDPH
jgi:hypothetical protein